MSEKAVPLFGRGLLRRGNVRQPSQTEAGLRPYAYRVPYVRRTTSRARQSRREVARDPRFGRLISVTVIALVISHLEVAMTRLARFRPIRLGAVFLFAAASLFGLALGSAVAAGSRGSNTLPCHSGGERCSSIGFTDAWFDGQTVQLGYSHAFFCDRSQPSQAKTGCEAGTAAAIPPPSGPVVSNVYLLIPLGFSPPASTLQCRARCIDQPTTIDLSRVFSGMSAHAVLGPRSFVIEDPESFQSTWWPVVLVGVKNLTAWNTIVAAKNIAAVDDCQTNGGCAPEVETNAFVFFQVLGPGMSPQGPA